MCVTHTELQEPLSFVVCLSVTVACSPSWPQTLSIAQALTHPLASTFHLPPQVLTTLRDLREAQDPTGKPLDKAIVFLVVPIIMSRALTSSKPVSMTAETEDSIRGDKRSSSLFGLVARFIFLQNIQTSFLQAIYSYLSTKRLTSFTDALLNVPSDK